MKQSTRHKDLIKAWLDGAFIQYKNSLGNWIEPIDNHPSWLEDLDYRIKPEPKLVPFTFDDHADLLGYKVRSKSNKVSRISIITSVNQDNVCVGITIYSYQQLLDLFEFLNGNPCGKEVLVSPDNK